MNQGTAGSFPVAALIALALTLLPGAGSASPLYSGTVSGTFIAPVLAGVNINADGSTSALDNTLGAVFSGVGTDQLAWGACDSTCGAEPYQSVVTFAGVSFVDVAPGVVFKLGTLSFQNGSSFSNTLIFGATLSVGVNGSFVAIGPAVAQMGVFSTVNAGASAFANADFLHFDLLLPDLHAFEGATVVADVYGHIDGDPQLVLATLTLPPDQAGNGFLLPEPGNTALLGVGLAVLGLSRRNLLRRVR